MKRKITTLLLGSLVAANAFAGGLMTNTNYHIAFDRMMARGASIEIDGTYSNPAGLVWGKDGGQLSFNWQSPRQNRDITTTFPLFPGENNTKKYHGKASAPFVPGLFGMYKRDRWAVSAMVGIFGSGGYVKYDNGLPMFEVPVLAMLTQSGMTPEMYTIDTQMRGKQYIYGAQANFTYRLNDHFSAAIGVRASYYDGYYRGHLVTTTAPALGSKELINVQLDVDQRGWGWNPIIGLNYRWRNLTLAARYEFRTRLNIPNKTHTLSASVNTGNPTIDAAAASRLGALTGPYQDGAKTRYDMPALLSVAAGYEFRPNVRATLEYHFFDDKNAKMAGDRQKTLKHGTHEFLAGVEWDITKMFTVSAGGQRTDYGLSDDYQQHTSFACDSYSVGLGGAVNVNRHVRLNVSYFWTMYSDYKKHIPAGTPGYLGTGLEGTDRFSRTNGVFGLGIDYKF